MKLTSISMSMKENLEKIKERLTALLALNTWDEESGKEFKYILEKIRNIRLDYYGKVLLLSTEEYEILLEFIDFIYNIHTKHKTTNFGWTPIS